MTDLSTHLKYIVMQRRSKRSKPIRSQLRHVLSVCVICVISLFLYHWYVDVSLNDKHSNKANTTIQSAADIQYQVNKRSQSYWPQYEFHRNNITRLLITQSHQYTLAHNKSLINNQLPTLAVLGAGNCNDLQLNTLLMYYRHIDLYDIDSAALHYCMKQHGFHNDINLQHSSISIHTVDLTGVAELMQNIQKNANNSSKQNKLIKYVYNQLTSPSIPSIRSAEYDVVVSTNILSQLCNHVYSILGRDHKSVNTLILAIRNHHLGLMLDMLQPNGIGLLVSDLVSSDTLNELHTINSNQNILNLVYRATQQRNFFTGCNPYTIMNQLSQLPNVDSNSVQLNSGWIWTGGNNKINQFKHYLVVAISFQRNS